MSKLSRGAKRMGRKNNWGSPKKQFMSFAPKNKRLRKKFSSFWR